MGITSAKFVLQTVLWCWLQLFSIFQQLSLFLVFLLEHTKRANCFLICFNFLVSLVLLIFLRIL